MVAGDADFFPVNVETCFQNIPLCPGLYTDAVCLAKNKICSTSVKFGSNFERMIGTATGCLLCILCHILETKDPKRLKTWSPG